MMDILIPTAIITLLILLNALFVAAEFAIVGAPRASIERRAANGERLARLVHQILQNPQRQDRFIATAQLGITLASLGLGMYGEHVLAEGIAHQLENFGLGNLRWIAAHTIASITAVAILTYFHIVVGEMVPKSLALQSAERTVLWITPLMQALKFAMYPFVIGLNALGNAVLRLAGINRQEGSSDHLYSPEELALIVAESQEGGLLRAETGNVVRELFEFGDLTAREAMVPRVKVGGIPLGASAADVRALVAEKPHTRYPVYDGDLDHIVGLVHIKDLLRLLTRGASITPDEIRPIPYVPETTPLDAVLANMRGQHAQMAVVLDEHGGTAGVITLEDLFEEVAGEIPEGTQQPQIYRDAAGLLHAAGTVRIEEVGEALGCVLEHEEVDSVSGLVMTLLGRSPQVGDTVEYDHVKFEVVSVERHAVRESIVTPAEKPEKDTEE